MQALGATIITALAVWLCVRILKGRRRWRGLSSSDISQRLGSLGNLNGHKSSMGTPVASLSCTTEAYNRFNLQRDTACLGINILPGAAWYGSVDKKRI